MRSVLLYLYPATWRRRYGEEFTAMLEERRPGLRQTVDILRGALDARMYPRLSRESMLPARGVAMAYEREELREELRAVLAAREELGAEHEQDLMEGFLDRLEEYEAARPSWSARSSRRPLRGMLVALVIAAAGGAVVLQHHIPFGAVAQAKPLPDITRIDAEVPAPLRHLPLTHYTNRQAPFLLGYAIVDDYGGPYPYAYINFNLRYRGCPITRRGAFRLTIERVGYRITGYARDGRVFIAHTGPPTPWSRPAVFRDHNLTASLMFPTPQKGLYYWKVEVPSARGCAWRIDYNGT